MSTMGLWSAKVLPFLIEKACRSSTILEERKRWVPRARGDVLELGVGSGLNLAFYDPGRVQTLTAIDPAPALLERARARIAAAPVPVELVCAPAERLPFADRSFDSVIVTYSLCSVDDPLRVLAEVRRVLRPGRELVLVEHGLAQHDPATQRWQHRVTPVWRRLAGGCRLDRDMLAILREARFTTDEVTAERGEGSRLTAFSYQGVARPV